MRMIVAFAKGERLRHIGHLDLQRAMQRILRRSGLPIQYSQGFNPHVILSFASPLPVGMAGEEECFEVGLAEPMTEEAFAVALREALPPDLPLLRVRAVEDRHPKLMASLRRAAYEITLPQGGDSEAIKAAIPGFLAQASIPAVRVTKSGEKPCDIRPMLHELVATQDGLTCSVSFMETQTLKPDLLLSSLAGFAGVAVPQVTTKRLRLLAVENGQAVPLMDCQGR